MTPAFTFPANADKSPRQTEWQRATFQGIWKRAELVGAPTGTRNGFDVLDIDPHGVDWYDSNFDALPQTFAQATPRGLHLYFRHAPGLRCSTSRIAAGVDVRAEGGYVILWGREGLPFEDAPLSEWPDWLLKEARGGPLQGRTPSKQKIEGVGVDVGDATEALHQLDPCAWRGEHDEWFALLMGAKAAGIACDDFVEWSIGDPEYADDAEIIRVKWNSIEPRHPGAFLRALKDAGIKLNKNKVLPAGGPPHQGHTPTISLRSRTDGLRAWLAKDPTDDRLFTVAATFGEIILEKRIQRWVANDLLEGACQANGLWKLLGPDRCRLTIANGFRHVEEKFLGERE
jgi:Bifunctional DNA primase/polymerase, N-terminal/Primase C terminal 2 (PriCT-2)